jgi:hypothetical protein
MSENFESTYESSFATNKNKFYGDFELPLPNQEFWEEDGISLTGNPHASPDQIVFTGSGVRGGFGEDHLVLNPPSTFTIKMPEDTNKNGFWKYNEDKILKQLEQYISGTYSQHYVDRTGGGTEQTLDKIKHNRREGFCAGNVTKYIDRYDTKGTPRADLFKVLHYTILLINHLNLIENK